jgi:hypothetical protein
MGRRCRVGVAVSVLGLTLACSGEPSGDGKADAAMAADAGSLPADAAALPGAGDAATTLVDAATPPDASASLSDAMTAPEDASAAGQDAAAVAADAASLPGPDASLPSGPDASVAAVLDVTHTGWNKKNCWTAGCHTAAGLSKPRHNAGMRPPDCAACHGANGACDANGASKTDHQLTDNCLASGCHNNPTHGYTVPADCAACHLAALGGSRDCKP